MKNIYLLSFNGTWAHTDHFIPVLWPSAKTHYEHYGKYPNNYNWVLPISEFYDDIEQIKQEIAKVPPDIFGVSLYVWNFEISLIICEWVKSTYPNCIVITGGPHQYFKHHQDWFLKHSFIDASLPSEVYGEVAITDFLDNLTDNNKINWNLVEKIVYPSKDRKIIFNSPKSTYKLDFIGKWNYSAFFEQKEHIKKYVNEFKKLYSTKVKCKIETTRGCPYSCTFCDWGGGVGSKVIVKDINFVKQDIDTLLEFNPASIFVTDANFGINGERDVNIIKYFVEKKKKLTEFPQILYGGFAKTNRHFKFLKEIFELEAQNQLSELYKISQQSFNHKILDNIKRTDLRDNEHFELANYLRKNYYYDAVVELILGLPGMTLDIWYTEFDKPYQENVIIRAYEWWLLPEAESYDDNYRKQYGLLTSKKLTNSYPWSMPAEMVVGSNTLSREDYKEVMVIYSLYFFFVQTGVYRKTINSILDSQNIKFGNFLKHFHIECYPKIKKASADSFAYLDRHLTELVSDQINTTQLTLTWNNDSKYTDTVLAYSYMILEYFKNFEILSPIIEDWLIQQGGNYNMCKEESDLIHSEKRMNTVKRKGLSFIKYNNFKDEEQLLGDLLRVPHFVYGNLLTSKKKFLGLI